MSRNAAISRGIDAPSARRTRDQARVPAIGEHADDEEQPAGADAVREHLVDRALHALTFIAQMPSTTKPRWLTDE